MERLKWFSDKVSSVSPIFFFRIRSICYTFWHHPLQLALKVRQPIPWVPEAFHARSPVAARVFGLRPKTCRPVADEAPRRTRENTSGTQGR